MSQDGHQSYGRPQEPLPPLAGVTVVGLEHSVAGPLCTRILADLGADVIKVERAGGDFARHWDANAAGEGAQFWWLNRRKRSVVLDLNVDGDRTVLESLLTGADVLVHNMSPAAAARRGLDSDALLQRYPRLVNCQLTGYGTGTYGPRKAYDMLVQAESGMMSLTGTPEQPMRSGVSVCDVSTGIYAAVLVLAALRERDRTRRGRYLEIAMFDAALEFAAPALVSFANSDVLYPRLPDRHHAIAPYGAFECADGERLLLAVEQDREWAVLCERFLDQPELVDDERFATNSDRLANREALEPFVRSAFARRTGDECAALLGSADIAYARLNDMSQVAGHPVTAERGILTEVDSAAGVPVTTIVGLAERAFGRRDRDRERPPTLGEDGAAVLSGLVGIDPEEEASRA